jgi:hypothetical protein
MAVTPSCKLISQREHGANVFEGSTIDTSNIPPVEPVGPTRLSELPGEKGFLRIGQEPNAGCELKESLTTMLQKNYVVTENSDGFIHSKPLSLLSIDLID